VDTPILLIYRAVTYTCTYSCENIHKFTLDLFTYTACTCVTGARTRRMKCVHRGM